MPNGKMNVLFISTNNAGVKFYRYYQFAQKMSELGLAHCRIFPDFDSNRVNSDEWEIDGIFNQNIDMMDELVRWADVIVCQYIHSPLGFATVQAMKSKKPVLMEVDDHLRQVPYYSHAHDTNPPGGGPEIWATRQAIESNGIVTSTEFLKNYWSQWNKNVFVVPNCINFEEYDKYDYIPHDRIRIGWIGGANHDGDLKLIKNVVYDVMEKNKDVEFYFVSFPSLNWDMKEQLHLIQNWVPITEYQKYLKQLSYDVGLAPLRDNEFNRGKSNLRYLEYSACQVPTIASDVEPFRRDFTGLLANSYDEWMNSIMQLIESKDYRLQVGWDGYQSIKEKFNLGRISTLYAEIVKEFI